MLSDTQIAQFKEKIWDYYHTHKRILSWRQIINPYHVFVTELMLQQTQVSRVAQKFPEFIKTFPTFAALAQANSLTLLQAWQGLGYNRRAKYLQQSAFIIQTKHAGTLPSDPKILETLPGIGPATANSIVAYAYNKPVVFIETNIRRIFIHFFFPERTDVSDAEIFPLVAETLDHSCPREWYYALMDYGTMLKTLIPNPNRRSKQYTKQSKFEGSNRQIRGEVIRTLLSGPVSTDHLFQYPKSEESRVKSVINQLEAEGFIVRDKGNYRIK